MPEFLTAKYTKHTKIKMKPVGWLVFLGWCLADF